MNYISAKAQKKQSSLPGYHYFKKIENFMNDHCDIGDLYMEFVAQKCIKTTGTICNSCMKLEKVEETGPVPRPMPDYSVAPNMHYMNPLETPTHIDGSPRAIDDFQPRVQLRSLFESNKISLEDDESVKEFSRKFIVEERIVRNYLEHLNELRRNRKACDKKRKEKRAKENASTYNDYKWKELQRSGKLRQLNACILQKYIDFHHIKCKRQPLKKKKSEKYPCIFWEALTICQDVVL